MKGQLRRQLVATDLHINVLFKATIVLAETALYLMAFKCQDSLTNTELHLTANGAAHIMASADPTSSLTSPGSFKDDTSKAPHSKTATTSHQVAFQDHHTLADTAPRLIAVQNHRTPHTGRHSTSPSSSFSGPSHTGRHSTSRSSIPGLSPLGKNSISRSSFPGSPPPGRRSISPGRFPGPHGTQHR
eukprot:1146926-Pelagomonas_calceolata.AAC.2